MPTRRFGNRLFLVIVGLVALAQAISVVASLDALRSDALRNAEQELAVGQRVFERLLAERASQLATAVRILASDYGFKEAIASNDQATIESVLANHGSRVGADLAAFIARDASVVTSTHAFTANGEQGGTDEFPFAAMLSRATDGSSATGTVLLPGSDAYQLVVTPVRTPELIGWVCIGFVIDDALAASLQDLTSLEVSFAPAAAGGFVASTLAGATRASMPEALTAAQSTAGRPVPVAASGTTFLTLQSTLPGGDDAVVAVLQGSLDDALAAYRALVTKVLVIAVIALALAIGAARVMASSVTRPLTQLAGAARRIASGFYGEPVAVASSDEFGLVARAFDDMQQGIAEREARIVHQARHDGLTGLPNRLALRDRIDMALARAARGQQAGAILLADIVAFKGINDSLGHHTGDSVLKEVGRRLAAQARACDTVARYGGNGFVVVLEDVAEAAVMPTAERILALAAEPLQLPEAQVRVDLTVGISRFPQHGDDAETLLRRAEIALYAGRSAGHALQVYAIGEDESHLRRLALLKELAIALAEDQLELFYQPQLDLRTGQVRHAEALVRWQHPARGLVPPDEFIGLAEQSGLIGQLTQLVLRKVIRQIQAWSGLGIDLNVSVNISAIDLTEHGFADRVLDLLRTHGVDPRRLTLEVTESTVIRDMHHTREVMRQLREVGIQFSIDDFGTGYSSLAQLRSLPLHELKIDKSFVLHMHERPEDVLIVRSTIDLAHNLGLVVCAEGVESATAIAMLQELGCDIAQGYGISRPVPALAFADWLTRHIASGSGGSTTASGSYPPLEGGALGQA